METLDTRPKSDEEKRKATDVLREIEMTLATLDGISTTDAFKLGGLVREYGDKKAGEASSSILNPLLDAMIRPKKTDNPDAPKPPWL